MQRCRAGRALRRGDHRQVAGAGIFGDADLTRERAGGIEVQHVLRERPAARAQEQPYVSRRRAVHGPAAPPHEPDHLRAFAGVKDGALETDPDDRHRHR